MALFAYLAEDGQVRLQDPDGGLDTALSNESVESGQTTCAWPTWSPDGSQLAYVRYEIEDGHVRAATVRVAQSDGLRHREIYRSGQATPIYLNWSPDARRLGLLVQEGQRLSLHVLDSAGHGASMEVAYGAPLYFAWHAHSHGLLVHVGTGDPRGATRLVWAQIEESRIVSEPFPAAPAPGFRVPAWASLRQGMTVALTREDGARVGICRGSEEPFEELFACAHAPALAWNPSGEILAFGSRLSMDGSLYDGIWLYHASSGATEQISQENTLAFFWSPDGRRVVCATGPVGDRMIGLKVLDVATRKDSDLGFVRPSRDLLLLMGHFDQYSLSARLISASSNQLLLAASRAKEQENGSVPTVRQILLRSLGPDAAERVVARGRLAFWRP